MEIPRILESIRSDNSRKAKESILTNQKNNNLLKDIFYYTYNPLLSYYIRAIPDYTPCTAHTKCMSLKEAIGILPEFYNRVVTGNAAIDRLSYILSRLHKDNAKIFECIITRDLRCGVSESTINKIWENLLPSYPCLLASPDTPKNRAKIKFPAIAQEKCDGMRINAIVACGRVEYKSRNGMPVDCATPELNSQILEFSQRIGTNTSKDKGTQ